MEADTFKRILTAFVDRPVDLDFSRGNLLMQVRDEVIEAGVFTRDGALHISEASTVSLAEQWIIQRLARLPLLAERIVDLVAAEPHFVVPSGKLLDELELDPEEHDKRVVDVVATADEFLARRPGGTASVLYLTADAGEGKSTVISELARRKAEQYRQKTSDWLLVPISLGGRQFLRFDDITVASLVNRFRFPYLYYEAFLELIKLGALVPAYDGFEEMFIEGSTGEAVSALGSLMHGLSSAGSIMIAARQAYFEYKRLETQARLFDTLGERSVIFSRLKLERWDRAQFLSYGAKRRSSEADRLYQAVATRVGPDHPFLTRAVLVRRLFDLAEEGGSVQDVIDRLTGTPTDHFAQFVRAIVTREAHKNWIERSGEPARPLISESDHEALLATVAREMWVSGSEVLRADVLDFAAEDFCEMYDKSVVVRRQVVERLKQHALIVRAEGIGQTFRFDHAEFYHYFVGVHVAQVVRQGKVSDVRQLLRRGQLPYLAADVGAAQIVGDGRVVSALRVLSEAGRLETNASFVNENAGTLAMLIISRSQVPDAVLEHLTMSSEALTGRRVRGTSFAECYFHPWEIEEGSVEGCRFRQCEFEELALREPGVLQGVSLIDCRVRSVMAPGREEATFVPDQVSSILTRAGAAIVVRGATVEQSLELDLAAPDDELKLAVRTLRAFARATQINESTLRLRAGAQANFYVGSVLPRLIDEGVLREVPYHGKGVQRRFRLGVQFEVLNRAIEACDGEFGRFLEFCSRYRGDLSSEPV